LFSKRNRIKEPWYEVLKQATEIQNLTFQRILIPGSIASQGKETGNSQLFKDSTVKLSYILINQKMSSPKDTLKYVEEALHSDRLAVLATTCEGQPHASLIAIAPFESIGQLVFATYRNTRKFRNITLNSKVAVLMERGNDDNTNQENSFAITVYGHAQEISIKTKDAALQTLSNKHPNLKSFTDSFDCALMLITVDEYQLVQGIDNITYWPVVHLTNEKEMISLQKKI